MKIKLALRAKVIIAITVIVIGVAIILSWFFISYQKQAIRAALIQRGLTLASNLAFTSEFGVLTANTQNIQNLIEGAMQQPDVAYGLVSDLDGRVLGSGGVDSELIANEEFKKFGQESLILQEAKTLLYEGPQGRKLYDIAVPVLTEEIRVGGDEMSLFLGTGNQPRPTDGMVKKRIGVVRIGLSLAGAERLEAKSQQTAIVITVTIIIVAGLITTLLTGVAIVPIRKLVEGTHKIARGELDFKVDVRSADELGLLASSFNKMTDDLKRSRNELIKAKDYTDNIIRSMIDILVVADPKGIIKTVNPATLKILGYSEEELVGEPIDMIFSPQAMNSNPRVFITKQMLREGFLTGYEMVFRKKSGEMMPVLVSGAVMVNNEGTIEGIVGIAKDISDRKKMEEDLKESNERFNTLATNMPGMIYQFVLRPDGSTFFPYVSPGCRELFGIDPEVVQRNSLAVTDQIHKEDKEGFDKSVIESARRLEPWRWEGRFISGNAGDVKWIQGASRPKRLSDGSTLWDGLLMDVSERKVAQSLLELRTKMLEKLNRELVDNEKKLTATIEELKAAHGELKKTQFQLIQAEKLKVIGRLASGVAHEVKNPLAIILQGVSYLSRKVPKDNKDVTQVIKDIHLAVERADSVIKGVLDFSALSDLKMELVNISDVIDASLLLVKHELDINHIEVVKVVSKLLPKVKVDKNKIEQVFVNIVMNAVQAMEKNGKITIKTYPKKVSEADIDEKDPDHFALNQEVICIDIENTGPSIPPANLKKIFEPFFTTKAGKGGTGLGLPIIKNIVDLHKGRITIDNRNEGGVRATVMLRV